VNKNWILFFDEADALFGKRTQTSSSNDRYANQEISYLLQRVEDYPGVVILATNLKANIDEAFARRFQTSVHFAMPDADQRLRLWQGMFVNNSLLSVGVNLVMLAETYELSGGAITNAVRYAAIQAVRMKRDQILLDDLVKGVIKELLKEGRTL
jgi:SpoVK/Ycf46/Vps4 family AAA+-type ATPase